MEYRPAEVNSLFLSLIIKLFEFLDIFNKELVCMCEFFACDCMLVKDSDGGDELAEVEEVAIGKDFVKQAWAKNKHVREVFPCLIATGNFLSRITRRYVKRSREVRCRLSNGFSMMQPNVSLQDGPVPCLPVICSFARHFATPERKDQVSFVECDKVHEIVTIAERKGYHTK